jgi:cell wall-associated NlpC family hydrolase
VVETALAFRGTPYRNGGSDPRGFDCSGFTQYVFARFGVRLPRETRGQFAAGAAVAAGAQRPGDLVFFTTTGPGATHVGILIGRSTFVHAPSSRGVVRVESMTLPYWSRRVVGIRRVELN